MIIRPIAIGKVLYHRVPFILIFSVSLYGLILLGTHAYYRFMPASWFLYVRGVPVISSGNVDATITLTFCRDTRYQDIKAVGARSFYRLTDSKQTAAGEYNFKATIEHTKQCQYIPITSAQHPNHAGTYLSHTDLTFYVNGYRKVASYDTASFTLSDTKQSLQQQIENLEQQIQTIKDRQSAIKPASSATPIAINSAGTPTQVDTPPQASSGIASSGSSPSDGGTTQPAPAPGPTFTLQGTLHSVVLQTTSLVTQLLQSVL